MQSNDLALARAGAGRKTQPKELIIKMRKGIDKTRRPARCQQQFVRLCIADVENLELAADHMTEAADCMSGRGAKALAWQKALCIRLRRELKAKREKNNLMKS